MSSCTYGIAVVAVAAFLTIVEKSAIIARWAAHNLVKPLHVQSEHRTIYAVFALHSGKLDVTAILRPLHDVVAIVAVLGLF